MGRALVNITNELILQHIGFPHGTKIIDAVMVNKRRYVEFLIEHDNLKEVVDGAPYPKIVPMFASQSTRVMYDWGQKEANKAV